MATPDRSVDGFRPSLHVDEIGGRVRLRLAGLGRGEGATLQEASDDLLNRLLVIAMALRSGGVRLGCSDVPAPDLATLDFLYRLGEIAALGGDVREYVFGAASG